MGHPVRGAEVACSGRSEIAASSVGLPVHQALRQLSEETRGAGAGRRGRKQELREGPLWWGGGARLGDIYVPSSIPPSQKVGRPPCQKSTKAEPCARTNPRYGVSVTFPVPAFSNTVPGTWPSPGPSGTSRRLGRPPEGPRIRQRQPQRPAIIFNRSHLIHLTFSLELKNGHIIHSFVCRCMKSVFILFNIFDLSNCHLTFIGPSPLLHLLQELHVAVVCTEAAGRQDGILSGGGAIGASQQQDPGTVRGPQAVRDKGFSHRTPVQKGAWRAHQEPELKPRVGGGPRALFGNPGLLPNPRAQASGPHTGQVPFTWAQVCGESEAHQRSSVPAQIRVGMSRTDIHQDLEDSTTTNL